MTIVFNYRNVNYFTPLFKKIYEPVNDWIYDDDKNREYRAWVIGCAYDNCGFTMYFESKDYAFKVYNELLDSIDEYYREVGKHMKVIR